MFLQVFLSIKGIYYQAEIQGQTVTWITPYSFTQKVPQYSISTAIICFLSYHTACLPVLYPSSIYPKLLVCLQLILCVCVFQMPSDVDFRVILTFVEFYATLVGFINFRLYHCLNLKYPPQVSWPHPPITSSTHTHQLHHSTTPTNYIIHPHPPITSSPSPPITSSVLVIGSRLRGSPHSLKQLLYPHKWWTRTHSSCPPPRMTTLRLSCDVR